MLPCRQTDQMRKSIVSDSRKSIPGCTFHLPLVTFSYGAARLHACRGLYAKAYALAPHRPWIVAAAERGNRAHDLNLAGIC